MSNDKGGVTPKRTPVGWVFLDRHRHDGYTIRWQRGDAVAYVLSGKKVGDYGMSDAIGTIPVSPTGWTDVAEIRALGQRWLRQG